ncbi:NADH:flavin oxidoreductase [Amycolatopsis cynarae]|uniref:NADH:flavin oxidoreductase n=1 Tax=Amycolatopsis cynarae TaxID=2995223 RepID=A0ABY7B119_9PSEU|nr:NADH:flavin oxidoreductase [Amycolatopsis sp. HUAS 11-8]WAL65996.1 NADH:flavin oxidoreductase [Amycolatopsis sp. HUAS 11-8]
MTVSVTSRLVLGSAELGPHELANRAVVAPMSRVSAGPGGVPTRQMADYYASFAAGGFGLVLTEGTYPDAAFGQAYQRQPGLVDDGQQQGWQLVTEAVHAHGAVVIAQLMHAGALSQYLTETLAPSAIQPLGRKLSAYGGDGPFPLPSAMTAAQIDSAVNGFVDAAKRAHRAGFDGVEIHAANGYLLDQFITRYTNTRTDEYGGDSAGRIRLTGRVLAAIRSALPAEFVVGVRLSQTKVNDMRYRWSGRAEAAVYFAAVAEAGADFIHIASEGRNWHETAMLDAETSVTALARAVTGLPVIANGGMHRPELAEELLRTGQADLVSLGGGALANPDWPHRLRDGRPIEEFDHHVLNPSADLDSVRAAMAARS